MTERDSFLLKVTCIASERVSLIAEAGSPQSIAN